MVALLARQALLILLLVSAHSLRTTFCILHFAFCILHSAHSLKLPYGLNCLSGFVFSYLTESEEAVFV